MRISHYEVLGLNANGLNDDKKPYTDEDIRQAYRNLVKVCHPDKQHKQQQLQSNTNQSPPSDQRFKELHNSYEILINTTKRASFDEELRKNPLRFESSKHLFIDLPLDAESTTNSNDGTNNNSAAIVVHQHKGIDLTRLMIHANYDSKEFLKVASKNFKFAERLLDSIRTFNQFGEAQQFELLLIAYQHLRLNENASQNIYDYLSQKPTVKQLLDGITAHDSDYYSGSAV